MQYAFLVLMCVFAGLYAAIRVRGSFGSKLTVKTIASLSFVLIAFAGRLNAAQPYYALIMIGLCLSVAGDILLVFPGPAPLVAGGAAFFIAHIGYIAAFFVYAPLEWYDALLFAAFAGIGAAVFAGKKNEVTRKPRVVIYAIALCAMAAKAVSMLFVRAIEPMYGAFAALGGVLFAFSDLTLAYSHFYPDQKPAVILSTLSYYGAQALLALSIAL